jgi:hypothetical protein
VLVNDLKALSEEVKDKNFSHKFFRCLPSRFGILVTLLVRSGLDTMTPNQVLGDVMTDNTYRDDDEKGEKKEKKYEKDEKKKSVVFKATSSLKGKAKQDTSSEDDDSSFDDMDDEKMALFVKRFGKFMVKKGYCARRKKSSSKSKDEARRCFMCGSKDHLIAQCPYNSENEDDDKKDKKDKKEKKEKMTFKKKKKKGGSYVVTWDSDASSSDDDDKTTKKKVLTSIAIIEKPSVFDTPSTCFMVKAPKGQTCDDGCDEEHDNKSESDDDDEPTKDELIDMLKDAKEYFDIKRKKCKNLRKELKALKQAFDELNASHERLEEAHEKLGKAHKKFEKAHSSLFDEQNEKEHVVTCDKGLTCDIINESFYKPIDVAPSNPLCSSSSTFTSPMSDGFTCDASLIVENETLKKKINELSRALGKAYGDEDRLLICLGSQRASLYKEGLGYTPKKDKATFAPHKTSFIKNNGQFCTSCKQVGHIKQEYMNKKSQANVSSIKHDSFLCTY